METEPQPPITNISKVFDTKEVAISAIKTFWQTTQPDQFQDWSQTFTDDNFADELTSGDRTQIRKGLPYKPDEKGKWVVDFRGNNQPLSEKAVNYFKSLEKAEEPPKD